MQQLQSRKAWGVTRAELERQLAQQRRSAEADKAASLQSIKDLFQRCSVHAMQRLWLRHDQLSGITHWLLYWTASQHNDRP